MKVTIYAAESYFKPDYYRRSSEMTEEESVQVKFKTTDHLISDYVTEVLIELGYAIEEVETKLVGEIKRV